MYKKVAARPDIPGTDIFWSQPEVDCATGINSGNNIFNRNGVSATLVVTGRPSLSSGCSDANHTQVGFDDGDRLIIADPQQGSIRIRLDPPVRAIGTQVAVLSAKQRCPYTCKVRAIGDHGEIREISNQGATVRGSLGGDALFVGMRCDAETDESIQVIEFTLARLDDSIIAFAINQLTADPGAAANTAAAAAGIPG